MTETTRPPIRDRHEIDERRSPTPWILGLLAVVALVVVLFFVLGGDADADGEPGDIDVDAPELDVDVDAPDVDLEAPDIDVDPGDVDVRVLLGDRVLRVPARIRTAVEVVAARSELTPGDLPLDPASALVLCRRLVREGLLEVVR